MVMVQSISWASYSLLLSDSTISSFLILRENIKFTNMDNENVIAAVSIIFVRDIEGRM